MQGEELVIVEGVSHAYRRPRGAGEGVLGRLRGFLGGAWETVWALQGVSLRVERGERVAVLGPNGAGKSTLLKIILGVLSPTRGRVRVFGVDPYRMRRLVSRRYGVVFGNRDLLWWHVPVIDSLRLLRRAYGLGEELFRERLGALAPLLCEDKLLRVPPQRMSLGQRRRCELLAALLHGPELLVLDEPFLGLDIFVRERIRRFLHRYHRGGGTILLTTHELAEIPGDYRVVLLHRGRVLYDGGIERLRSMVRPVRYLTVVARGGRDAIRPLAGVALEHRVEESEGLVRARLIVEQGRLAEALSLLDYSRVVDVQVEPPGLEELIRELVGRVGEG